MARIALRGAATAYEISFRGRTFSARVEPLREPNGHISGVIGVAFDVTDRRRAEDALRESEERLSLVLEATRDGVWDYDFVRRQAFWSPRLRDYLGIPQDAPVPRASPWTPILSSTR